jgi:hypothetical protein
MLQIKKDLPSDNGKMWMKKVNKTPNQELQMGV